MLEEQPAKPILIFDGRCGFCRIWIEYWKQITRDKIDYAPYQEAAEMYPGIPREQFQRAVHLVFPSGEFLSGAAAVFRTLAFNEQRQWPFWLYQHLPGFRPSSEAAYRLVANHRDFFYHVTVLLFGRQIRPLEYKGIERSFLKILGLILLVAFSSFGAQSAGLIGSHGIQPASLYLTRVAEVAGSRAYWMLPSVLWLGSGDGAIQVVWLAGVICSVLILFGVFWRPALLLAFVLYLSLFNVSQEFLSFQWDILLLETSFLAIFLGYSNAVVWLFRWLLFRLMFLSGAVKLLSGDATWHNLTALTVHFQTQPLPTPLAWYAHNAPRLLQQVSCAGVFFVELIVPLFVLGPRRARMFAAPWLFGLQLLILLTGNYAFFNWLTLALSLFLFDDAVLAGIMPERWLKRLVAKRTRPVLGGAVAVMLLVLSGSYFLQTFGLNLPGTLRSLLIATGPYGVTSSYGLFASMTTVRPEIVIEGSADGINWFEYQFRYKPGRLNRPPPWVAPHQPRLDWQMWFAALGSYRENIWFLNTLLRLLQGSPEVLGLMGENPFPKQPPKFVRAQLYEYRFGDRDWWTRKSFGLYVPAVSLADLNSLPLARENTIK